MTLGHLDRTGLVLIFKLLHQQEGHVFIINVQDEVRSALVDSFGQVDFHQAFIGVISLPYIVLIDKIQRVPLVVVALMGSLGFTICMERLVRHYIDIEFVRWLKSFSLHPLASVACELYRVS